MISYRRADHGDLDFLFKLRNEKSVRAASFNSALIDIDTHRRWLERKLAAEDCVIYVAEMNALPIAEIRFDLRDASTTEVGVAIIAEFRGRGYGAEILRRSAALFFRDFPDVREIRAFIMTDNQASIRSFAKAGYVHRDTMEKHGKPCVRMILTR